MRNGILVLLVSAIAVAIACSPTFARSDLDARHLEAKLTDDGAGAVQVGQRPMVLVDGMDDGNLKEHLQGCADGPFYRTDFSIGHRGAALLFAEYTRESYEAAARQGAGIIECDATFTSDGALVCRHAECDLHLTTNIVETELNDQCTIPWSGPGSTPKCCTSDLSLAQFKSLNGKTPGSNAFATAAEVHPDAGADRLVAAHAGRGTLLTHAQSIELIKSLGGKFTPELKSGNPKRIKSIFGSQAAYAQKLVDEYKAAGVPPIEVWPQSFNVEDVLYWIEHTDYGKQAVYLLNYNPHDAVNDIVVQPPYSMMDRDVYFRMLKKRGVRIVAPPIPALLQVDSKGMIKPSALASDLKQMGFEIITWSFERSDVREGASKAGYYYDFDPNGRAIRKESDIYKALDVLAKDVGVRGIFSDWPATVTYYANCMGLD